MSTPVKMLPCDHTHFTVTYRLFGILASATSLSTHALCDCPTDQFKDQRFSAISTYALYMMNRLKTKGMFFKDGPDRDEMAANLSAASCFFRAKIEKPLPVPPSGVAPLAAVLPAVSKVDINARESASLETEKPLPPSPVTQNAPISVVPSIVNEKVRGTARKSSPADRELKSRPSFASLRSTSSRIFRANTGGHDPPPPPVPQLPIDTPMPKPRRPTLRPFGSIRSARTLKSSTGRNVSISRPILCTQTVHTPSTSTPSTVPFTKPPGPPPRRPARPESLDDEIIAFMRDGSARLVLHTRTRVQSAATTAANTSPGRYSTQTRVASGEAYTRLGLPSGRSSLSPPTSSIFDSTLTPNFPLDPTRPLPFRDSTGSVKGYGRFSAYIKARQQYKSGGYDDGVDADDREVGPIEQYRKSRCGDWTLEARISERLGERGMVFRDRWGRWRFVADI
ncbi:hypothetical protein ST47_g9346 [Ascochyta rabiei]|uniref:Uncharacterized protein n=1 Tax=Didymella rabiei TaxID=5454 RepID=A0A162XF93_DIDRA|nr:hypothetical protein ST47_g9346 [Ascochyta rabiei]